MEHNCDNCLYLDHDSFNEVPCKDCNDFSLWKEGNLPSGVSSQQEHYKKAAKQPIEVIQALLEPGEFKGFLKGQILRYKLRAGTKEGTNDIDKARQYEYWLCRFNQGIKVNPNDAVPERWRLRDTVEV